MAAADGDAFTLALADAGGQSGADGEPLVAPASHDAAAQGGADGEWIGGSAEVYMHLGFINFNGILQRPGG